ncbi:MAG: zinc ABC transporter substrate-binding protein [Methanimicrococcus sp.]|nr:zinc ABC transporter substrate-binding protein [Methanimicrococcus sp.]
MKSKKILFITAAMVFLVLIAAVSFSGCLDDHDDHDHVHGPDCDHDHGDPNASYEALDNESVHQILNGSKILVAVSVVPQTEFVEKVGGDKVIAISMIPPGAGHNYDPSPRQLEDLSKASLYIRLDAGEPFENNYMNTFTQLNRNMTVVSASKGLTLIRSGNSTDPHIWTSPKCAMIMVENTYEGLAQIDPANASYYRENADAYLEELKELDADLEDMLSGLATRNFMIYHPAWGYLSRDYNLTQIAIEVDGKEPSPKAITQYIDTAKKNNIKVIFVQEQVSVSGAQAIAEGIGGVVYVIDPLAKNYVENMRHVGTVLSEKMS